MNYEMIASKMYNYNRTVNGTYTLKDIFAKYKQVVRYDWLEAVKNPKFFGQKSTIKSEWNPM